MRYNKQFLEIANKYCDTVSFYRDLNDPYSIEEIKANKYQAADKRKFIIAYLEKLSGISYRLRDDIKDKQKLKLLAVELCGTKDALLYLFKAYYPELSAFNTIYLALDNAGRDLCPEEYNKIFPR